MSRAARRDTAPELALRRLLHSAGLRYRVNYPVPGNRRRTIDIAFIRARLAVFIDGCFWHSCPEHGTSPAANSHWWETKLSTNSERDRDTDRLLEDAGWEVLRIWEHEAAETAAAQVIDAIARCRAS
ncbi:Very-short-patch mismatch repair endonuclease (G-T specific) [Actinomycetales bacterium JB111]|nr:Very-short-patch mismatch repair endonuclease (G-T specific) [Actinomycetales bacterium JB111]